METVEGEGMRMERRWSLGWWDRVGRSFSQTLDQTHRAPLLSGQFPNLVFSPDHSPNAERHQRGNLVSSNAVHYKNEKGRDGPQPRNVSDVIKRHTPIFFSPRRLYNPVTCFMEELRIAIPFSSRKRLMCLQNHSTDAK